MAVHGPKICLAGSGGGHLRQLLDLEPVWSRFDAYILTEDTALGRSLTAKAPVDYVQHYTLGQARIGHPFKMMRGRDPEILANPGNQSAAAVPISSSLPGRRRSFGPACSPSFSGHGSSILNRSPGSITLQSSGA